MPDETVTDALTALAVSAQQGDHTALETLLSHPELHHCITYVARQYVPPEDVEDVCQDIRLKVAQHLASWQQRAKITTWISKMTVNHCLTLAARQRRMRLRITEISFPDSSMHDDCFPPVPAEQVRQVAEAELLRLIQTEFLARMEARCQEILSLLLFKNLDKQAIRQRFEVKRSYFNELWKTCCEKLLKKIMQTIK